MTKEFPDRGELVFAKITKILPHGAFCELEEYENKEAFLHISEVASRWIKNIHEFLAEGKVYVVRVTRVTPARNMIDVSLKRVNEKEAEAKQQQVKREKRAQNLVALAVKKTKLKKEKADEIIDILTKEFGDLHSALEYAAEAEEGSLEKLGISKSLEKHLLQIAQENIKKPIQKITGVLSFTSYAPNGVEDIRACLGNIDVKVPEETKYEIIFMGAPRYRITIESRDFKIAEKILKEIMHQVEANAKKREVVYDFQKEKI